MSTSASIKIQDEHSHLWFYRHYDGYPSGTLPTLEKFLDKVIANGKFRDNVVQACGWLIVIGREEYNEDGLFDSWKVGAYEPATGPHGDIDYLYTVDLVEKEISFRRV